MKLAELDGMIGITRRLVRELLEDSAIFYFNVDYWPSVERCAIGFTRYEQVLPS